MGRTVDARPIPVFPTQIRGGAQAPPPFPPTLIFYEFCLVMRCAVKCLDKIQALWQRAYLYG